MLNRLFVVSAIATALVCVPGASAATQEGSGEWRHYASDAGSTKYSGLDRIDASNVGGLEVAWSWTVADAALAGSNRQLAAANYFESTPLMIGGALYVTTPLSQLAALDAATGRERWVFDPGTSRSPRPPNIGWVHRGAAWWSDGRDARLIYGTGDAWLIAIDPAAGTPIATFGENGRVDLTRDLGRPVARRGYGVSSPPVICGDVIIIGSSISDGSTRRRTPPGDVRGYDVRTGRLLWTFHTIPRDAEFGVETWEEESWRETGNTNVWAPMSFDAELGYVYLPVSTPTNDFWGGERLGDNLFAESLVCLDAATGKRVWHYQFVHHGVWDYDLPCAPNLVDITVEGRAIKAVAQLTKHGLTFVLDRVTGEPVWPIEERPVAASEIPGERLSPTQPFPVKPPPFERLGVSEDDLIDFTPELRAAALEIARRFRLGPLFTPPSMEGTIQLPGYGGGANWGGGGFDPETGVLYVPSIVSPMILAIGRPDPARSEFAYARRSVAGFGGPDGLPLLKPPYSTITAIDLNRGEILWQVPNGDGPRDHPLLAGLDLPPLGSMGRASPLVTRTLLFVGEGAGKTGSTRGGGGPGFKAYDKATGEIVWETVLAGPATGAPMTYLIQDQQFIVVAVGSSPAQLIALALPSRRESGPR